jgi:hypothetical protein
MGLDAQFIDATSSSVGGPPGESTAGSSHRDCAAALWPGTHRDIHRRAWRCTSQTEPTHQMHFLSLRLEVSGRRGTHGFACHVAQPASAAVDGSQRARGHTPDFGPRFAARTSRAPDNRASPHHSPRGAPDAYLSGVRRNAWVATHDRTGEPIMGHSAGYLPAPVRGTGRPRRSTANRARRLLSERPGRVIVGANGDWRRGRRVANNDGRRHIHECRMLPYCGQTEARHTSLSNEATRLIAVLL